MDAYLSMTTPQLARLAQSRSIKICSDKREDIIRLLVKADFSKMTIGDLKRIASEEGLSPKKAKITLIEDLTNLKMFDYTDEQRYLDKLPERKGCSTSQDISSLEEPVQQKTKKSFRRRPVVKAPGRTKVSKNLGTGKYILTVYTVCEKCGEEIYSSCYTATNVESVNMHKAFSSLFNACPKCKSKLGLVEGHFIENYLPPDPDKQFEELHKQLESNEKTKNREAFNAYLAKVKPHEDMPATNKAAQAILSSSDNLKEYILHLIHMESEIYLLGERLLILQHQEAENARSEFRARQIVNEDTEKELQSETADIFASIENLEKQIKTPGKNVPSESIVVNSSSVGLSKPKKPTISEPIEPRKPEQPSVVRPTEPTYHQPGLFNKKRILAENAEKKRNYDDALADYLHQMAAYEEAYNRYLAKMEEYRSQLAQYTDAQAKYSSELQAYEAAYKKALDKAKRSAHADFKAAKQAELKERKQEFADIKKRIVDTADKRIALLPQARVGAFLSAEQEELRKELQTIIDGRDQLYSYNIIYGKYRNYVALTSIYEYLDSGRCNTLDGPQGAYNLFETESRANEIILQLSAITASLEAIKSNQFMLYKELKRTNHDLETMNELMNDAVAELQKIDMKLSNIRDDVDTNSTLLYDIRTAATITGVSSVLTAANTAATAQYAALTAHYSAIGAHYAKTNAELTNALGVMTALNRY